MAEFIPQAEARIKETLDKIVASGLVPGCGVLIGSKGEKVFEIYSGIADKAAGRPVGKDTLYRMYSMTKLLLVTAVMQCWDKGLIRLNDKLSAFIPEFADVKVAEKQPDGTYVIKPAKREILIYDLLTMTSGLPYDSEGPTGDAVYDVGERWLESRKNGNEWDTVRFARELAKVPLNFNPGEHWQYGLSHDVLGAVIQVVTGDNLAEYLRKNVFEPLGMSSATFKLTEEMKPFMAEEYDGNGNPRTGIESHIINCMSYDEPTVFSGGAGLICTADDYFKFTRMLSMGGTVDGKRLLSRKAIEMISTPQLTLAQIKDFNANNTDPSSIYKGYSYGLGVRVCTEPNIGMLSTSKGEYGWAGALGTWMIVDPTEDIFVVYVHQRIPTDHEAYVPQLVCSIYSSLL